MNSKTIVLCDHNKDLHVVLRLVFKETNVNLVSFERCTEALEYLRANPSTGLLITEMTMPGMSGMEFLDIKQSDHSISDLPTIIFSGRVDTKELAKRYKVKAFVEKGKSIEREELLSLISEATAA